MKRFLFIGHDASRTGAPMVLLHFLRWLKENFSEITPDLMLLKAGELEAEYRKVANVYVMRRGSDDSFTRRGTKYLRKKWGIEKKTSLPHPKLLFRKYDAVIANTAVSIEHLKHFKRKGVTTFCWLHELDFILHDYYSTERFVGLSADIDNFIVVSEAGRRMVEKFGIDKKTNLVYEFSAARVSTAHNAASVRQELGIPANAFVVGACGTAEWRKGVDLFLQMAVKLKEVYFLWVGDTLGPGNSDYRRLMHDLDRYNLGRRMIFTGSQKDPHKFFSAMDIFALTSREDPFPLVCLEAASLSKPIICFDGAGGMPEFVENDAGAVVQYGDVDAFCEQIQFFNENRQRLTEAGKTAHNKVKARFSAESLCRKMYDILTDG